MPSLSDRWLARLKNNPIVAICVVVGAVVVGLASFHDAIIKLFGKNLDHPPQTAQVVVKVENSPAPSTVTATPQSSQIPLWECIHPNRRPHATLQELVDLRPSQSDLDQGLLDVITIDTLALGCAPRLLDAGANVNAYRVPPEFNSYYDGPPLHLALFMKRWDIVRLLLSKGADPNKPASHNGDSALRTAISFRAPQAIKDEIISRGGKNFGHEAIK